MPSACTHSVLAGSAPLGLLCQLYLQLTCPLPSLALYSQKKGVGLLTPSRPPELPPSMGRTCCPSLHSGALLSSGMALPVSEVPGGKVITDSVTFQRLSTTGRT